MERRRSSKRCFRPELTTTEHLTGDFTPKPPPHPPFRKPPPPRLKGIIGISSYKRSAPLYRVHQARPGIQPLSAGGTGPLGAYSASDLRTAYQIPVVAIYEQGGFTASDVAA